MRDRDAVLSVRPKSGHMLPNAVRKAQLAFLDQRPDRRRGDDLGVRKERKERPLVDRARHVDGAEAAIERELALPRDGKLRSWMVTAGYVRHHDLTCAIEFRGIE